MHLLKKDVSHMGRMLKQMSPVGQPMQAILRDAYQDWKWAELCSDCIDFHAIDTGLSDI